VQYNFIVTIIVLNLLIALFNETFISIMHGRAEHEWNLERARIMLNLEADMPDWLLLLPAVRYWVDVGGHPFLLDEDVDAGAYKGEGPQRAVEAAAECVQRGELAWAPFDG